jgi:hypothetical protein
MYGQHGQATIARNKKVRLMLKNILIVSMCLFASYSAHAATIVTDGGYVTGIDDLLVNNSYYDVSFVNGSYNDVYGSATPTFWNDDMLGAYWASQAMLSLFSDSVYSDSPELFQGCVSTSLCQISSPFEIDDDGRGAADGTRLSRFTINSGWQNNWSNWTLPDADLDEDVDFRLWAVYSYKSTLPPVEAVPVPAAAWLFGSALLGLGAIKRKKA